MTKKAEAGAMAETMAPAGAKASVTTVPQTTGARPLRTPDEWGMLAVKVKTIIEEEQREDGRKIRRTRLECPELDDAVLMTKNTDYVTFDSNGVEYYHQVAPKTVYFPKKAVESAMARGYEVVENAPDWRYFKPKAE